MSMEAKIESQSKAAPGLTSESPLMREVYVFGGAIVASAKKASSNPSSLIKLGEGALMGAAMTALQAKARPLAIGLEMIGLSGVASASQSPLKTMTEFKSIWQRTWNSSKNIETDKAAAQKLTDGVVDFGLYAAGGLTAPSLRALQLRPRWQEVEDLPFFREPSVPPSQKMAEVFRQKADAHAMMTKWVKNGVGEDATFDLHTGTGIVLKDYDNLILTAHHVVKGEGGFAAIFPGRNSSPLELLGVDKKLDAALLRMTEPPVEALPGVSLSPAAPVSGQDALLIGYPALEGSAVKASFGNFRRKDQFGNDVFDLRSKKGFSGGSILDESGQLTSMITHTSQRHFLPGAEARLIKNGSKSSVGPSSADLKKFIEANRHNVGVKLKSIEDLLPAES